MVTVRREAHEFSRAILNSEDAEEFNVDGNKYLYNLRKKASKFLLRMTLQEIDAINHNTVNNLLEYIARGVELSTDYFNDNILIGLGSGRKESLAMTLGLFGSGNFFIDFLSTSTWSIDQVKSFIKDNGQCVHQLVIKFNNSEDELNVSICTDNKNTYKFLESDISLLQEKKQFCPYFTDNSIYKELEITKLGGYNVLKNDDETIYLADSFIIGPVDDFSLFEKSKLIVAGVERIFNIKHNDLQAKVTYALMTE